MRLFRRERVEPGDITTTEADLNRAYERGRADERARHHGHPILGFFLLAAALAGGVMIYLAAQEGSFSRGGQVVDQHLAVAADKAQAATQVASQDAHQAGQSLRQNTLQQ